MRSGYCDDIDQKDLAMWRGRVASAMRGRRGQRLLRLLLTALDEMPNKRLIRDEFARADGDVCLLGAGGKKLGMADLHEVDPEDHHILADRFNVASCLIQEMEYINDEAAYGGETPERRYERVRKWVVENIRQEPAVPCRSMQL